MKIVEPKNKKDIFGSLKDGEVAYDPAREIYIMRVFPIRSMEDGYTYNAVSLQDGDVSAMETTDPIVRVNSKLVIGEE